VGKQDGPLRLRHFGSQLSPCLSPRPPPAAAPAEWGFVQDLPNGGGISQGGSHAQDNGGFNGQITSNGALSTPRGTTTTNTAGVTGNWLSNLNNQPWAPVYLRFFG